MMPGKADMLKQMEDELVALKKKPAVNSIAGDHLLLARAAKEAEEKRDRKNTVLKANLQKRVEARGFLVKQQQATREELIVEHERMLAMHDKQFKLQVAKAEEDIEAEKKKGGRSGNNSRPKSSKRRVR